MNIGKTPFRRWLLLILLLLAVGPVKAAVVDVDAARDVASRVMRVAPVSRFQSGTPAVRLLHSEPSDVLPGAADYYVFGSEAGFAIIAGDDRIEPVMAQGEGHWDSQNVPCNVQWLLDHYKEQIEYLHSHPSAQVQLPPVTASTVISPLLPCNWSQGTPYNDQCPVFKGGRCVTGCIATAMAQVMYYWRYPDELPELPPYISRSFQIYVPGLPGTALDWDGMLDGYKLDYTESQGEAVATLMRYCGQASSMDYGTDGSGSGCWNQLVGMQVFGYNLSARLLHRDDYTAADWNALMLEDLADGYPILYSGYGDEGGHAFVVDGYTGRKYHINWGWGGDWNGDFYLDLFIVAGMDFTYGQEMQHRLYPENDYREPYDFEADGLCYRIAGDGLTVTHRSPAFNSYSGNVVIPERVTQGGVTREVTAIGNGAFRGCSQLTGVTLPSTLKRIGKYAFKDCARLTRVDLPDGVERVDYGAFEYCVSLSSVSLGSGLEEIGYYAFSSSGIQRIHIPAGVKTIGNGAFLDCSRLGTLTFNGGPSTIGDAAFARCTALTRVAIGDSTLALGRWAFYGCKRLASVTLGENLEEIGMEAFHDCTSLERLVSMPELPPVMEDANCFDENHYATTRLLVPAYTWDNYFCDDLWTYFVHLGKLEDEQNPGDVNVDGEVNIADVNTLIDAILASVSGELLDVNGDGEVNIADVNAVIDLILTAH